MLRKTLTTLALALAIATPALAWDGIEGNVGPDTTRSIVVSPNVQEAVGGTVTLSCHHDLDLVRMQSSITMNGAGNVNLIHEELRATYMNSGTPVATVFLPIGGYELTNTPLMNGFRYRTTLGSPQHFDCDEFGHADSIVFVGVDNVLNLGGAIGVTMSLTTETAK